MKLRHFLDAAVALFVEEYQRTGMDMLSALDAMKQWAAGDGEKSEARPDAPQNAASLQQLNSLMSGFK